MQADKRLSRPAAAADRLGEIAPDRHRFAEKRVLLTGEPEVLNTENGAILLDASLRLLVRLCSNLSVAVPVECPGSYEAVRLVAEQVAFGGPVEFLAAISDPLDFDAVLSVGTAVRPEAPWTVINSNGWLARVSSGVSGVPSDCGQANPIGALFAASLGVTEVFKRLICLKPERGRPLDAFTFNTLTYQSGSDDPGPPLPSCVPLDTLLVGAGAIGNGVLYLLGRLPVAGRIWVVDRDVFKEENLGTCILIGLAELGQAKARFAERVINGRIEAVGFPEDLSAFKRRLGTELPYPRVVLGAVDSIDSRHEIQALWPDLIIDGAIGDFPCQVSRHRWGQDEACLRCLFRTPPGESAEMVASRASGLRPERVADADETITEHDVLAAPQEKQEFLRRNIGRQICSVIAEATAQQISLESQRPGFEPSIPFVACFSACMMVAELVKQAVGWESTLETRFQWDSLRGPHKGQHFPQGSRSDCLCVERRVNIERFREGRKSLTR